MKRFRRVAGVVAVVVLVWFVAGVLTAQTACAHDPRFACSPRSSDRPIRVADPSKSWAFYGRLQPGASDTYTFGVSSQVGVPISTLIERADAENAARPVLRLSDQRGRSIAELTFTQAAPFHEPFSGVDYLTTPDRTFVLEPGRYTAVVTMLGGNAPQRYVVAIGEDERFGIGEIPYVLGAVYRVRTRGF